MVLRFNEPLMQQIRKDSWNFKSFFSNPFLGRFKDGWFEDGIFFWVFCISSLVNKLGLTFKSFLIGIIHSTMFRKKAGFLIKVLGHVGRI